MTSTDLWRPAANRKRLTARANLLQAIRTYFAGRNVMEVETPVISAAANTDPSIESIKTKDGHYLRTSPEFALKRLLAAGSGDIYELGRVFRAGESGRNHNPEFTMLEWYRTGFDYHRLMEEVADLVRFCGNGMFEHWPVSRLTYQQLFLDFLDIDPFSADIDTLRCIGSDHGIDDIDLDQKQWQDLLIGVVIQPALPEKALTFVYDFPGDQAALARIRPGSPPIAQRFELYLGQTELANGYQELTDADEQLKRFESENAVRLARGQPTCPVDHHLVSALSAGMPECAGVALGVDRLLMMIENGSCLDEVTAFPHSRA